MRYSSHIEKIRYGRYQRTCMWSVSYIKSCLKSLRFSVNRIFAQEIYVSWRIWVSSLSKTSSIIWLSKLDHEEIYWNQVKDKNLSKSSNAIQYQSSIKFNCTSLKTYSLIIKWYISHFNNNLLLEKFLWRRKVLISLYTTELSTKTAIFICFHIFLVKVYFE